MASPLVSRTEALKRQTHHQFVPGLGYLAHTGAPELPATAKGDKNCDPAAGTKDGTLHLLKPPNGAPPIVFSWIMAEKAWGNTTPDRGNRLAWPTAHLQRAGWEYVGPANGGKKKA